MSLHQGIQNVALKDWNDLSDQEKQDGYLLASLTVNFKYWHFKTVTGKIFYVGTDLFFTHPAWAQLRSASDVPTMEIGPNVPSKDKSTLAWRIQETFLLGRVLFKEREPNDSEIEYLKSLLFWYLKDGGEMAVAHADEFEDRAARLGRSVYDARLLVVDHKLVVKLRHRTLQLSPPNDEYRLGYVNFFGNALTRKCWCPIGRVLNDDQSWRD